MGEESLSMKKEVEGVSKEGLRTEEEGTRVLPEVEDGGQEEEMLEKELKGMSLGDSSRETENGTMEQGREEKEEGDDVRSDQGSDEVDQALKDALARHRHRNTVLLFEQEMEKFVRSDLNEYVFEREMTTYERLLAHRTAQHWGLATATLNVQGPSQGRIVATRTESTGTPGILLADVEVKIEEEVQNGQYGSGPTPRLLTRKGKHDRGNRQYPGGYAYPGHGRHRNMHIDEREQDYERARARIFGDMPPPGLGYPSPQGGPGMPQMIPYPYQMPMPHQNPTSPRSLNHATYQGLRGHPGKAQMRNRQEDLSDPDFRRGRTMPRFDPGFGEDVQGNMYIQPSYSSEYPELGHTSPRNGAKQGNNGAPGPYPSAMGAQYPAMVATIPYGYSPQGMYPQGAPPMQFAGQYMSVPYGYIPMRPGSEGMMMPMPMYANGNQPAMFGAMPPQQHPGGMGNGRYNGKGRKSGYNGGYPSRSNSTNTPTESTTSPMKEDNNAKGDV